MKRGLIILVCLCLILILLVSTISAFSFSDFWNKITGKVVETCTDSDGGLNYYVKGTTCIEDGCKSDRCTDSTHLSEYYCQSRDDRGNDWFECPYGCTDGACIEEGTCTPDCTGKECGSDGCGENMNCGTCNSGEVCINHICTPQICTDSDVTDDYPDGKNYFTKGTVIGTGDPKYGNYIRSDICYSTGEVLEHFCSNGQQMQENYMCPNGCQDGACIEEGACTPDCAGKECGSDGCGNNWNCGICGGGESCSNGICITCKKEGDKVNRNPFLGPTDEKCCEGLTEIRVSKSYGICVNCGDGICKSPEDESNCPQDCIDETEIQISIATLKDFYNLGEQINLTDPPEEVKDFGNKQITGFTIGNNQQYQDSIITESIIETGLDFRLINFKGYIIELKDDPILVKKNKLEKKAEENKDNLFLQALTVILPLALEPVLPSNVQSKLEYARTKIKSKRENFKQNALQALRKSQIITGNAVGNNNLVILEEYEDVFNGLALNITQEEAGKVKAIRGVERVYPNYIVNITLMDSVPLINADDVWQLDNDGNDCGVSGKDCLTGKGITIGIIDTGIDYTHIDLGGCFGSECKVIGGYDFVNNDNDPMDDFGHGTHCAATAAGNGVLKGVAPDAELYAYKVLDFMGRGYQNDIIAAIERSTDPNQDGNFSDYLDIISLSLGGRGNPDDPMSQAIDNAVSAGVVAVIAAGNAGPSSETIGSPGTARKAITVGASTKSDNLISFSSRGPVIWEDSQGETRALIKPDVVAPGVSICAAQWDNAWSNYQCLDNEHTAISGTSMATPHVAGAAALLLQKNPTWTPEEIKMVLRNTAININEPINTQGYGRIDVLKGVESQRPLVVNLQISSNILAGDINIIGSVLGENLQYYKLEYGSIINPDSWIEFFRGYNIIENDIIGNLDTNSIDDGRYTLRLTGVNINGNNYSDQTIIKINNDIDYHIIDKVKGFHYYSSPFVIGDINGDSKKEIIATESGGFFEPKIWVWNKDGSVLRGWPKNIDYWEFATGNIVYAPALSDIDNDGINEVLLVSGKMVYAWNSDGTNVPGFPIDIDPNGLIDRGIPESHEARFPQFSVGDLDNNGNKEIISILTDAPFSLYNLEGKMAHGILYVFDNIGQIHTIKILNGIANSAPAIGDINQDGKNEIVVTLINCNDEQTHCGQSEGSKIVVLNKDGEALNDWPVIIPYSMIVKSPILGDLNKDGTLEILIVLFDSNTRSWKLIIFNSNGNIINEIEVPPLYSLYPDISLSDVNGDNFPEIILRDGEKVIILDKDGNKLNEKEISSTSPAYSLIGDVDADGDKEILIWNTDEFKILDKNLNLEYTRTNGFGQIGGLVMTDLEENNKLDIVGISKLGEVFLWKDIADYDSSKIDWSMFMHDPQHTGCYNCDLEITPQPERLQSKIVNNKNEDVFGVLLIYLEKYENGTWRRYPTLAAIVHEPISIPANGLFKLDWLFNSQNISIDEEGNYSVNARFIYGGKSIEASWNFIVQ